MGYTHLTMVERESIAQFHAAGCSIPTIALLLRRHSSTIYRELGRNASATLRRKTGGSACLSRARKFDFDLSTHPR